MNRAQKILHCVASRKQPTDFPTIVRTVQPGASTATRGHISAQLHQLTKAGKLKRTGEPGAFRYSATARTLVDGRKVDRTGAPRNKKALQRTPKAAKRVARAVPAKPPRQPYAKTTPAQKIVIGPSASLLASVDKADQAAALAADVAAFLQRGGRIQKLAHGERGQTQFGYHQRGKPGPKPASQPNDEPIDDDFDDDDAADDARDVIAA